MVAKSSPQRGNSSHHRLFSENDLESRGYSVLLQVHAVPRYNGSPPPLSPIYSLKKKLSLQACSVIRSRCVRNKSLPHSEKCGCLGESSSGRPVCVFSLPMVARLQSFSGLECTRKLRGIFSSFFIPIERKRV